MCEYAWLLDRSLETIESELEKLLKVLKHLLLTSFGNVSYLKVILKFLDYWYELSIETYGFKYCTVAILSFQEISKCLNKQVNKVKSLIQIFKDRQSHI